MVDSFSVRANKEALICNLGNMLSEKLQELQNEGWKIISVTSTPCKEYDYPKCFDSTLFTIVAEQD